MLVRGQMKITIRDVQVVVGEEVFFEDNGL
jgi:hypothetical protein